MMIEDPSSSYWESSGKRSGIRAADLGMLLDKKGHSLSQYSRHLRKESDVEYFDGYFEEPFEV